MTCLRYWISWVSDRAVLFGSSDCGSLCAMFAASHPERTAGLVLYATSAKGAMSADYQIGWTDEEWQNYLTGVKTSGGQWSTRGSRCRSGIPRSEGTRRWRLGMPRSSASRRARTPLRRSSRSTSRWMFARCCRPSASPHWCSTEPAIRSSRWRQASTSPAESHTPASSNYQVEITIHGPATKTRSQTRSSGFSPKCAVKTWISTGYWQPCCLPTSSTRRHRQPRSATVAGARCASGTTRSFDSNWRVTGGGRSRRWATAS